jgi:sugar phosphate isomerase/epimerase
MDRPETNSDEDNTAIDHHRIATVLRASGYTGFVSVEMRRTDTPVADIRRAVEFAHAHYG